MAPDREGESRDQPADASRPASLDVSHDAGYTSAKSDILANMEGYLTNVRRCYRLLGDENFNMTWFLALYVEKCRRQG